MCVVSPFFSIGSPREGEPTVPSLFSYASPAAGAVGTPSYSKQPCYASPAVANNTLCAVQLVGGQTTPLRVHFTPAVLADTVTLSFEAPGFAVTYQTLDVVTKLRPTWMTNPATVLRRGGRQGRQAVSHLQSHKCVLQMPGKRQMHSRLSRNAE